MRVLVIPVATHVPCYLKEVRGLKDMQDVVRGGHNVPGWIEPVVTADPNLVMIVNEEGALMHLPLNVRASAFYPGPIYGQVFLTYRIQGAEDFSSVPDNFTLEEARRLVGLPPR